MMTETTASPDSTTTPGTSLLLPTHPPTAASPTPSPTLSTRPAASETTRSDAHLDGQHQKKLSDPEPHQAATPNQMSNGFAAAAAAEEKQSLMKTTENKEKDNRAETQQDLSDEDPSELSSCPSVIDGDLADEDQTNGTRDTDSKDTPTTNGHTSHNHSSYNNQDGYNYDSHDERPTKRRRTSMTASSLSTSQPKPEPPSVSTASTETPLRNTKTPPPDSSTPNGSRRTKPISPPWKKIAADGPSSFSDGGRRRSGRINTIPLELQSGEKRITRRAVHGQQPSASPPSSTSKTPQNSNATQNANGRSSRRSRAASLINGQAVASSPTPRTAHSSRIHQRTASSPNSIAVASSSTPSSTSRPSRTSARRSAAADSTSSRSTRAAPRVRLQRQNLNNIYRTLVIPIVHPEQIKLRPRLAGGSLPLYFEQARDVPVEEGGLYASEDGPRMTDEMAISEAATIARIERETEPGGLLTEGRCVAFEPEPAEEPPRQWAHQDHLVKAMANFRRLMGQEQARHRATAKKLAEACRDAWLRRQPKSAEQIEAEARAQWMQRYRVVVRAVAGTWDSVRAEVNRKRLEVWEAEEQRRVTVALQEAVALSEQKLQARRVQQEEEVEDSSLLDSDEEISELGDVSEGDDDNDEEDDEDDESNMSSSSDEEEEDAGRESRGKTEGGGERRADDGDEGLTQEELRKKYANLPELVPDKASDAEGEDGNDGDDDTSDESVDMDDDLGSSDMGSDEEDDEEDDDADGDADADADGSDDDEQTEDEDEGDQANGLLGMLFGKNELKKMKEEEVEVKDAKEGNKERDEEPHTLNMFVVEENDEVSMIELPDESLASEDGQEARGKETEEAKAVVEGTASPETDAVTTAVSPCRSQSPRTSDTKPSDVDTPMSEAGELAEQGERAEQAKDETVLTNQAKEDSADSPAKETKDTQVVQFTPATPATPFQPAAWTPKTEIPFLLRGTLRAYQHYGLDWLAGLYANKTNGILADEMGLGKTIQTIALLAHLACHHEVWGPHLVIVPTSVLLNWEMEFKKWCPAFKIMTYYGSQEERKRKRTGWTNDDVWNVCITSYQIVVQDQQVFKRRRWHYMILDEAHNIKNFKSQRWQSLLGFNTQARLLLTGTPLQNNLTELWSLLFFLMPPENGEGGFADLHEFHDWFHKPESLILESGREQMDEEARAIIGKLHQVLRPYLLRRLKADVEKQMPAKYEHVEYCRLSKRQRELYDGFLARSDTRATLSSGNYLSIINCLMQLRKVCNHPDLFVDRPIMTSFRMTHSVPAVYAASRPRRLAERMLLEPQADVRERVSLAFLNLVPAVYEGRQSASVAARINQLANNRVLADLREMQRLRAGQEQQDGSWLDTASVQSNLAALENAVRQRRLEELQHMAYVNALRRQQRPVYGTDLVQLLTLEELGETRPFRSRPRVPSKVMEWFENDSFLLHQAVQPLDRRSAGLEMTISKFACVTPAVVAAAGGRMAGEVLLGPRGVAAFSETDLRLAAPVKTLPFKERQAPRDPWHEARMRLSIQFPDKRLLQYDCGKLQALDRLLRRLQAGGHRALLFTQMTKVLDILEQFLNIHGHKYLRLDGATKIEQRQILTDRFNHDNRILCFILSTRSGGLGINLTGADTVIFYDQDWNPAMDKQCQDRCHRIGQTRDVHIYRLVSEHTIEANILRKASQKQMLDDVVIQEGGFTTDYFHKRIEDKVRSGGEDGDGDNNDDKKDGADRDRGVAIANAAMDRVLGGVETADQRTAGRVLEQAEDTEDVAAARLAEREIQQDDADFSERTGAAAAGGLRQGTPGTPLLLEAMGGGDEADKEKEKATPAEPAVVVERNAWGEPMRTVDDYMLGWMEEQLQGTALELPKDKKKSKKKKGKDTRKR